ncbi:MAG TPA: hypothetical protein DCO72_03940 [Ruminococcus sp.]|nr:hypothetical protein [Ruminococcus sp.]
MTSQELYEIVRKEIDARASTDPAFRTAQRNIEKGNGDFTDSAQCSRILAEILGEKLANHILELPPDSGRSEVCQRLLKDHFDEISRKFEQVQSNQDKKNGINLNTKIPKFPAERAKSVGGSLEDTTKSDETIQRRCRNAVSNVANAMHDSFIQENAKFRNDAGLFVQVSRTGGADCCEWCAEVSGTFWGYNSDLREVFRRHDNCTCTITYTSSKTRSRLVGESDGAGGTTHKWVESRKSWQEKPTLPDVHPTRFTPEQAKRFETEQLQKQGFVRVGDGIRLLSSDLTNGENGGRISIASNAHPRDEELEKMIRDCIKQEIPCFADDLARNFSRIKPEENRYIVALHGNPNSTFLYGKKVDARTLANIIRSRKDYNGTDEIVLISCNTGNEENTRKCFAQKLADELDVTVHAPTKYGAIGAFGHYYSSTEKGVRDGEFKPFKPTPKNKKE